MNHKIPIWVIVACFVCGLWPFGVVLAIARVVYEDETKKKEKEKSEEKTHTVYHSGYVDEKVEEKIKSTYFYANSQGTVEPDTTYHYSYVKKDLQDSEKSTVKDAKKEKKASSNVRSYVKSKYKKSTEYTVINFFMWIGLTISMFLFLGSVTSVIGNGIAGSFSNFAVTMVASAVTAVLYLFKEFYKSRDYRITTYLSLLRHQRFYSIEKLAEVTDVSVTKATKDLQYMQSKGILGNDALIDKKIKYVILTSSARDEAQAEYEREKTLGSRETRRRDEEKYEITDYEKTLVRIRELNDDIDDEVVSEKIDTIEELTRKIFKLVEEKPSLKPQLESFLSYYLPTTLKLLDSYAYFEEQGIRGENIDAGMRNIEETLDMLIVGYKTQLDKLFEAQTMDVSTDINVLEQMMKADGFTKNGDFDFSSSGAFAEMNDNDKKSE